MARPRHSSTATQPALRRELAARLRETAELYYPAWPEAIAQDPGKWLAKAIRLENGEPVTFVGWELKTHGADVEAWETYTLEPDGSLTHVPRVSPVEVLR